jgi:hypothetical protein
MLYSIVEHVSTVLTGVFNGNIRVQIKRILTENINVQNGPLKSNAVLKRWQDNTVHI